MKKLFKIFLLITLVLTPVLMFAKDGDVVIDFENPSSVLTWLMPLVTLGATWLVKKVSPFITGTVTLIAVPVISTGLAYLGTMVDGGSSWVVLFISGIASVFLNQLYRNISSS